MDRPRNFALTGAALLGIAALWGRAEPARPDAPSSSEEGLRLHRAGRLDEAIACFDRAIAKDPECASAYLGRCWSKLGKFSLTPGRENRDETEAIADALRALELREKGIPTGPPLWEPQKGATAQADLTGTYLLYDLQVPDAKPHTLMTITAQRGGQFLIGGPGQGWEGRGAVSGRSGFYDFVFDSGKSGRNSFKIEKEGTIHGRVQGKGTKNEWHYRARRLEGEILLPNR